MPLSLMDMLGMLLRRTPVGRMRRALRFAEESGIPVTARELEAHYLCSGNIEEVLEAVVLAQQLGVDAKFKELAGVDLAQRDVRAMVHAAARPIQAEITTIAPGSEVPIRGNCQDRTLVSARLSVDYTLPLFLAMNPDDDTFAPHAAVGARALMLIAESANFDELCAKKHQHGEWLTQVAHAQWDTVRRVAIEYSLA